MKLAITGLALLVLGAVSTPEEHRREVDEWHAARIQRLYSPTGWMSLVGLMRLHEGENTLGSSEDSKLRLPEKAPAHVGTIYVEDGKYRLEGASRHVTIDGEPIEDVIELIGDQSDTGEGTTICEIGSIQFMIIVRPGGPLLRVKDGEAELIKNFDGIIERWPVDQEWQFAAEWIPYDPPKVIQVPNELGFISEETLEGYVRFELDGEKYTLDPMRVGDEFFFVFGDETNGEETYGAGRYFYSNLPDENGIVTIDFNLAYNMPCVFTSFATCSLTPEGNSLPFKVTAGEKMWKGTKH